MWGSPCSHIMNYKLLIKFRVTSCEYHISATVTDTAKNMELRNLTILSYSAFNEGSQKIYFSEDNNILVKNFYIKLWTMLT